MALRREIKRRQCVVHNVLRIMKLYSVVPLERSVVVEKRLHDVHEWLVFARSGSQCPCRLVQIDIFSLLNLKLVFPPHKLQTHAPVSLNIPDFLFWQYRHLVSMEPIYVSQPGLITAHILFIFAQKLNTSINCSSQQLLGQDHPYMAVDKFDATHWVGKIAELVVLNIMPPVVQIYKLIPVNGEPLSVVRCKIRTLSLQNLYTRLQLV